MWTCSLITHWLYKSTQFYIWVHWRTMAVKLQTTLFRWETIPHELYHFWALSRMILFALSFPSSTILRVVFCYSGITPSIYFIFVMWMLPTSKCSRFSVRSLWTTLMAVSSFCRKGDQIMEQLTKIADVNINNLTTLEGQRSKLQSVAEVSV